MRTMFLGRGSLRGVAVVLAFLGLASHAEAQQEISYPGLAFSSSDQSMWSTGDGFVFSYDRRFTEPANTGSQQVNPGPVSGSGVTVDTRFAVSAGGEVGVGVGFGVNGGLVDADLVYNAGFVAPPPANSPANPVNLNPACPRLTHAIPGPNRIAGAQQTLRRG